jgi:hypothetical protein
MKYLDALLRSVLSRDCLDAGYVPADIHRQPAATTWPPQLPSTVFGGSGCCWRG